MGEEGEERGEGKKRGENTNNGWLKACQKYIFEIHPSRIRVRVTGRCEGDKSFPYFLLVASQNGAHRQVACRIL